MVERSAVNRLVVGSNPTAGANFNAVSTLQRRLQRAKDLGIKAYTRAKAVRCVRIKPVLADKRTQPISNDTLSTMKALFSVILAFAVCAGSVEAGPVRTARHVARDTAITAKNVAHSTVKGTRRAVHTVVDTLTR